MLFVAIFFFTVLGLVTAGISFSDPRSIKVWPWGEITEAAKPRLFWILSLTLCALDLALLWFIILSFLNK
ncbi:hypothetical protein [Qipengyuania huizhouensis]|uniref:hypothetical protein n=1 Tax=Qipengyuania huizhouensis TaxID=2867245 RepID=UPI001C86C147|nr:hypothetical protein [Qipengyuania huizhouensis]MBX7459761.1 hypothetical protein [Qipengyuania huizhouensis]